MMTDDDVRAAIEALADEVEGELAVVVEITDVLTAFEIADAFGGRHMDLPGTPHPSHPLVERLGHERAAKVWTVFGGGRVRWPLAKQLRIKVRWIRGDRTEDIARLVGVSDATVYGATRGLARREPPRNRSRLSEEADERARIVQRGLRTGRSVKDLAQELKITRATVRELARRPVADDTPEPTHCPCCGRRFASRPVTNVTPAPTPLFERFGRFLPAQPRPRR